MTIENNTGVAQDLIGYQITSAAGTFNRTAWTPIAGRLDDAGNGTIDPDDNWVVLTAPGSRYRSERGVARRGHDSRRRQGGAWASACGQKYFEDAEDLQFLYADPMSDEPPTGAVEFVGAARRRSRSAISNFDGDLDSEDWTTLAARFKTNLAG